MRNKIYLLIQNYKDKDHIYSYFKYFETEWEKDKYKRKVEHIDYLRVIEDSSDMNWGNS